VPRAEAATVFSSCHALGWVPAVRLCPDGPREPPVLLDHREPRVPSVARQV